MLVPHVCSGILAYTLFWYIVLYHAPQNYLCARTPCATVNACFNVGRDLASMHKMVLV